MDMDEDRESILDNKVRNPSVFRTIKNYFRLPRSWDWVFGGLMILGVITTIVIICL